MNKYTYEHMLHKVGGKRMQIARYIFLGFLLGWMALFVTTILWGCTL